MSFRYKTIIGVAVIQVVMLTLLVWSAIGILTLSNERELIKRSYTTTELFAAANKDAVLSSDLATLESFVISVLKRPGIIYARVLGRDGVVLAEDGDRGVLDRPFQPDNQYADVYDGVFDASSIIEESGVEYGRVEIGFSISDMEGIIAEAKTKSIAYAGGSLILSAVFSFILGIYLTRSINHLRTGARNIADGNLGYQINVMGNDELAAAAGTFNEMSTSLKQLDTARSQAEGELQSLNDVLEQIVEERTDKLEDAYEKLKSAQAQMLQREKMASIGQLAAGVAHEINNPVGFIMSNLGTLGKYIQKLTEFIHAQSASVEVLHADGEPPELQELRKNLKLDYILKDIDSLIEESVEGGERIKGIVNNLKSFSRVDEAEYKPADINECIESTLNIVWNELKYNSTVIKEYGEIPLTKCFPQQLNQVFMNLLVNASHAIEAEGEIKIKTWNDDGAIHVSISDTGSGIPEEKMGKIFEPFFTTKEVGKGTGLGLSIAYDIVKKHNGEITVESTLGEGTIFTVTIPIVKAK